VIYTGTDIVPFGRGRKVATSGSAHLATTAPVEPLVPSVPVEAPVEAASESLLPGEHTMARRLRFAVVNSCTLASLSLGLLAIFLAMHGETRLAAGCLVACVAFDGIDGALARKLGVASPFGAQMDSLADMCSFGLAAPVVVYASLAHSVPTTAAAVACMLVAGCAAIRLARFNVSPKDGKFFSGVPTTMAAAVLALTVSSFPYAKVAKIVRLPAWIWLAPIVGALIDARLTFVFLVAAYLVSGPVMWLKAKRVSIGN
jgi:CDP-diacylglycerol--serine O-phosphatidyltransferase